MTDPEQCRSANFASVRRMLAAVNSGEFAVFLDALADDVSYEAPYYTTFEPRLGRASIAAMFAAMGQRFSLLRYEIVAEYPTINRDLVIVECRGDNVLIGSEAHYRNHYLMFITFTADGLVQRWREFSNPDIYRNEAE